MTDDERADLLQRLIAMQQGLRSMSDACQCQAVLCRAAGAYGPEFAAHMLREAIGTYSTELNRFVLEYCDESDADV